MKRNTLFALSVLGLLAGCGDQTLVAGLFINTPAITVTLPAEAFDGGSVQPTPITLGPYTALLGYLTSIDTSDITNFSSAAITPITGATVTLAYESCVNVIDTLDGGTAHESCVATATGGTDRELSIPESGGGLYELLSTNDGTLTFEQGVTYTMILQVPDGDSTDAYGASFQPGPPAHMVEFADKSTPLTVDAGTALVVHRDDEMVNGEYLPAALVVGQIDPNNPSSTPSIVCSSLDYSDPKTLALFALSDIPYRVPSFTIDSSAFMTSGYYVVVMVSITEGKASDNAFIGSTALAGSGDIGAVIVQ